MKEFLVIKDYRVAKPDVDASFDKEDKARQYADLCKLRDGGKYYVAKLIQQRERCNAALLPILLLAGT